jgi:glycosyltransferase involved in cell wall biosynthesis
MGHMKISIVIPTLNEGRYLPRLLGSLQRQTLKNFEIIVADADSTDQTAAIARAHGAKIVKGGLPAIGRNRGASYARGDFIFFLDADVKLPASFLERAYGEMQERFLDLATCEMKPLSNLLLDRVIHNTVNIILKLGQHSDYPHSPGFCILISRRLFERIGGFDEALRLAEDHDLVIRASRYRPLRVLDSTFFWINVRRFKKEGRLNYAGKVIYAEIHRWFRGRIIDQKVIRYEFGDFSRINNNSRLRRIERRINKMEMRYRALRKKAKEERLAAFTKRQLKEIVRLFIGGIRFTRLALSKRVEPDGDRKE